jgi:GDP-L-fucose synthase
MEEFLGRSAVQEFGLSVAIARPYNAYGPRDDFDPETSHVLPALIRKAVEAKGETFPVWGDGSHSRSFLYVDDFARGLVETTARAPDVNPINIGAREETTIRAAAEMIAHHVSERLGRVVVPTFDPAGMTGQPRRACDTSRAKAVLDYEAGVPLNLGLRQTVDWYVNHAYSPLHPHT